ncbi:MAG: DUF448 domain-containing protein [Deltaproteobacteria bacterium]|nr:MAG: DUF448 domain-containing protein [Deltaproteobacteria bacterium]
MTDPVRMCIACRTRAPQRALLSLRRRRDGAVVPAHGRTRHADGRRAYLCARRSCFEQAVRKGALVRALGRGRALRFDPKDLWNALAEAVRDEARTLARTGAHRRRIDAVHALSAAFDREEGDV